MRQGQARWIEQNLLLQTPLIMGMRATQAAGRRPVSGAVFCPQAMVLIQSPILWKTGTATCGFLQLAAVFFEPRTPPGEISQAKDDRSQEETDSQEI